jgi:hypothetical protein
MTGVPTHAGRRLRGLATVVAIVLLLAGGVWGNDDNFPFGPMRMYSTTSAPTGRVQVIRFEGVTERGRTIDIRAESIASSFAMRRAEIVGQLDRFRSDPGLLRHLVTAYERISADAPRLVELRLVIGVHTLRNHRSVSYSEDIVALWSRS